MQSIDHNKSKQSTSRDQPSSTPNNPRSLKQQSVDRKKQVTESAGSTIWAACGGLVGRFCKVVERDYDLVEMLGVGSFG